MNIETFQRAAAVTNFVVAFIVGEEESELILTPFNCKHPSPPTFVIVRFWGAVDACE